MNGFVEQVKNDYTIQGVVLTVPPKNEKVSDYIVNPINKALRERCIEKKVKKN